MRATFLGTADGHTSPTRTHTGIFLDLGPQTLLFECGAPAANYFSWAQIDPNQPGLIWLSHAHSDHIGQFPMLIQSLWLRGRRAPLVVCAPRGLISVLQDYLAKCLLFPELIGFSIVWHGLTSRKKISMGDVLLTPFATQHLHSLAKYFKKDYPETCYECFGAVIEVKGARIVHSADIAAPKDLTPVLRGFTTRALLTEVTHFPEKSLFEELAHHEIQKVFLTHYAESLVGQEKALKRLAEQHGFRGSLKLMRDGSSVTL
jgi:hypothetical protein